jgi:hypothetical protein
LKEEKCVFAILAFSFLFLLISCGGGGGGTGGEGGTQAGPTPGQPSEPPSGPTSEVTLSLSPESQSVNLANTFPVEVRLNTQNQPVTAASAYITFPTDLLEINSVNTTNPNFSIQAENIIENNLIKITSGEPNPGVNSSNALMATIYFRARAQGAAQVVFLLPNAGAGPSRVIKNDGLGTDILARVIGGNYIINP